jgi:integrase
MRSAPETFGRKVEAQRYLALIEVQIARGEWTDPARAKVTLRDYADRWISERAGLRPRTVELYRWLLGRHIDPWIGGVPLGNIDTPLVREWRATLLSEGVSQSAAAKAYRFLRSVLMTAVNEDRILVRNPCQVRGADKEQPQERPVLTVAEVRALAAAMPKRYRAMVLLATFASLRFGEVIALQRVDLDVEACTVRVRRSFSEVRGQGMVAGPPKSAAGRRVVSVPPMVMEAVDDHLVEFVGKEPAALVFTGPKGGAIRRGNFRKLTAWTKTVAELGLAGLHFHDLRHTGNTLAAMSGVSTRDLMARMGHDSVRAAIIYQHATTEADARIAAALEAALAGDEDQADEHDDDQGDDDDGPPETADRES